jgi:Ca2+:H+ antiporter
MTLSIRKQATSSRAADGEMQATTDIEKAPATQIDEPLRNHNGHRVSRGIQPEGESGRRGFHPLKFCRIAWRSSCRASMLLNILWPFVPAAILMFYLRRESTLIVFSLSYIAMLPAANLLGFAGQEMARKLPKVFGILLEITFSSVVEIVLFAVLIKKDHGTGHNIPVIKAAILGSILANLLLCLGLCFFVGGFKRHEQEFHEAVSEVGTGILTVAGFALLIPSAFFSALQSSAYGRRDTIPVDDAGNPEEVFTMARLLHDTLAISRGTAVILLVAFVLLVKISFPFLDARLLCLLEYASTYCLYFASRVLI